MDNSGAYAKLIAAALTNPALQQDELCFLHALHLRLLALGDMAEVTGDERVKVATIVSSLNESAAL